MVDGSEQAVVGVAAHHGTARGRSSLVDRHNVIVAEQRSRITPSVEAAMEQTAPQRLSELAGHSFKTVRREVAGNFRTPDRAIVELLDDDDGLVRLQAASNLADRPELHIIAAKSPDKWVRAILAHTYARDSSRSLDRAVQELLAEDDFREVRGRLAQTTDVRPIFVRLLDDHDAGIRGWCAANPRASRADVDKILTDRSAVARAAAVVLGIQFPDDEQLVRLSNDSSRAVLSWIVDRYAVPREALAVIAKNSDGRVARNARDMLSRVDRGIRQPNFDEWMAEQARLVADASPWRT